MRGAVLLAVLLSAAPARPADPPPPAAAAAKRVALERLRGKGVAQAIVEIVEERICQALGEASKLEVVCPADVATVAALARTASMFGECTDDDCVRRVDEASAAERRVRATLVRGDRGLVLELTLAGPGGTERQASDRLPDDVDGIVARVPGIVKKLFP